MSWIFTQLGTAVTAAYTFFVGEAMCRPMVQDAASLVPPGWGVRRARGRIRLKVLLARAGTDSVLGPVRTLTSATARAAAGDLEHPVPVSSDDELGVLTTSFNDMILGLREREALRSDKIELSAALQASFEDLQRDAEQLRASRARVVAAADLERRRMERDLHDGAQQQLVLLGLKLALAESLIKKDPAAAKAMHDELRGDLQHALSQLRDLAHGIYPAVLESEGLPGALREAAERAAIATELRGDRAGRYPSEVEAAVYFCCLEALQNAAKHAGEDASARIELTERDRRLIFEVADNGRGYDTQAGLAGVGVQNMTDRIGRSVASSPSSPGPDRARRSSGASRWTRRSGRGAGGACVDRFQC